jgi:hypothetical protein
LRPRELQEPVAFVRFPGLKQRPEQDQPNISDLLRYPQKIDLGFPHPNASLVQQQSFRGSSVNPVL